MQQNQHYLSKVAWKQSSKIKLSCSERFLNKNRERSSLFPLSLLQTIFSYPKLLFNILSKCFVHIPLPFGCFWKDNYTPTTSFSPIHFFQVLVFLIMPMFKMLWSVIFTILRIIFCFLCVPEITNKFCEV